MNPPVQPRSCEDPDCRERHAPAERVAMAMAVALCAQRGVRLTKLRRQVLELLWASERPAGAYALIDALASNTNRPVAPTTVYRALDFLVSEGLADKIESQNAFVPCVHPGRGRDRIFVVCRHCSVSTELEDLQVEQLLSETAARKGFRVTRRIVELLGTCKDCNEARSSVAGKQSPA